GPGWRSGPDDPDDRNEPWYPDPRLRPDRLPGLHQDDRYRGRRDGGRAVPNPRRRVPRRELSLPAHLLPVRVAASRRRGSARPRADPPPRRRPDALSPPAAGPHGPARPGGGPGHRDPAPDADAAVGRLGPHRYRHHGRRQAGPARYGHPA